jgi:hypothetical protein
LSTSAGSRKAPVTFRTDHEAHRVEDIVGLFCESIVELLALLARGG